nr:hypothetical protein [Tanacetum cinerariifolium]
MKMGLPHLFKWSLQIEELYVDEYSHLYVVVNPKDAINLKDMLEEYISLKKYKANGENEKLQQQRQRLLLPYPSPQFHLPNPCPTFCDQEGKETTEMKFILLADPSWNS